MMKALPIGEAMSTYAIRDWDWTSSSVNCANVEHHLESEWKYFPLQ